MDIVVVYCVHPMVLNCIFMLECFARYVLHSSNVIKIGTRRVIFIQGILIPLRLKRWNILSLNHTKWSYSNGPHPCYLVLLPYSVICRQELSSNLQKYESVTWITRELLGIDSHTHYPQISKYPKLDVIGANFINLGCYLI